MHEDVVYGMHSMQEDVVAKRVVGDESEAGSWERVEGIGHIES
jgi:hypothetical protein